MGAKVPEFAHLPMMLAPSGEKLSKRHGAVSAMDYRDQGYSPHAVLNYLSRFGWSADGEREVFSIPELTEAFSWERVGRGDGKFDAKKFLAIDHEHLKTPALTPDAEYAARTAPFLAARGLTVSEAEVIRTLPAVRERAQTFVEAADKLDFFFREPPVFDDKAKAKFLVPDAVARLRGFTDVLAATADWSLEAPLEEAVNAWLAAEALQIKDVAQAARVALTGRSASPGLFQVLMMLGRQTSLARLESGIALSSGA
jgi:glutamyl-tRNA synthetase